ncbi:hypothetical protein [Paraclostridium bifermentans]|uniref:hypothetical protein n=1 Tax=Paraclostridium bifermentans TaxID=1490 RepID=UPI00117D39EB|nr:hypothetical protein [Paraclostridium bifermentans]
MIERLCWIFASEIYKNLRSVESKCSTKPNRYISLEIRFIIGDSLKNCELNRSTSSFNLTMIIIRIS